MGVSKALFLIISAVIVLSPLYTLGQVIYKVKCDYSTPDCECPLQNDAGQQIEVCEYQLKISVIQTFFRYHVNSTLNEVGRGGELWTINSTDGDFIPHPIIRNSRCGDIDSKLCTRPHALDGYTFKDALAVNYQIPGPIIIVNQGQIVSVNVTNGLESDVVSIHWHGMHQRNTNFMDGAEHITQCGAPPGASFRYIFEATQSGTFWYHAHSGTQRSNGIYGALILREKASKIEMAQSMANVGQFEDQPYAHTLVLADWQLISSESLVKLTDTFTKFSGTLKAPGINDKESPIPTAPDGAEIAVVSFWSGLINGKGKHHSLNYVQTSLSIFTVMPNKQYRFRMVGAQGIFAFRVSIDGHKLKVIATDGVLVKPQEVDFIIIQSGERFDFLLETKKESELPKEYSDFAIRGETLEVNNAEPHTANAILHYATQPEPRSTEYEEIFNSSLSVEENCTENNRCTALNCPFIHFGPKFYIDCIHINQLELLFPLDDSELPDVNVHSSDQVHLNFAFDGSDQVSAINARRHVLPSTPLVLLDDEKLNAVKEAEFCTGIGTDSMCDDNLVSSIVNPECACTHVQELRYNRSIQMVFSAISPSYNPRSFSPFIFSAHPVHFHGHHFHVVDIQFGEYDSEGQLMEANRSIVCGGSSVCTNPGWAEGKDYSLGRAGKISSTAPLKDTITVPAGGYVVVYLKSDNPGYWSLHCHNEMHQIQGMAMVMSVARDEQLPAPRGMDICGNFTWTIEEFYSYLRGEPPTLATSADEDSENLALGLGIGLGTGLLLSLAVNVILLIYCCISKNKDAPLISEKKDELEL